MTFDIQSSSHQYSVLMLLSFSDILWRRRMSFRAAILIIHLSTFVKPIWIFHLTLHLSFFHSTWCSTFLTFLIVYSLSLITLGNQNSCRPTAPREFSFDRSSELTRQGRLLQWKRRTSAPPPQSGCGTAHGSITSPGLYHIQLFPQTARNQKNVRMLVWCRKLAVESNSGITDFEYFGMFMFILLQGTTFVIKISVIHRFLLKEKNENCFSEFSFDARSMRGAPPKNLTGSGPDKWNVRLTLPDWKANLICIITIRLMGSPEGCWHK